MRPVEVACEAGHLNVLTYLTLDAGATITPEVRPYHAKPNRILWYQPRNCSCVAAYEFLLCFRPSLPLRRLGESVR